MAKTKKISKNTVHADYNDPLTVVHYTRAAHFLGLWKSEHKLIARFFPDQTAPLLEAGCGAGRVTLGLWEMGYRDLAAFDFAEELLDQARSLATERDARAIRFFHADVTNLTGAPLPPSSLPPGGNFAGALFLFNGLMQVPGRENRRTALRELHAVCRPGVPLLFSTHDRDDSPVERELWRKETERWVQGEQDPRLIDLGDRYFENEAGRTFMHLPDRAEVLADLAATGWLHKFDAMRREIARESRAVLEFSDECRFWLVRRAGA